MGDHSLLPLLLSSVCFTGVAHDFTDLERGYRLNIIVNDITFSFFLQFLLLDVLQRGKVYVNSLFSY